MVFVDIRVSSTYKPPHYDGPFGITRDTLPILLLSKLSWKLGPIKEN